MNHSPTSDTTRQIANVMATGLPLSAGLRALADEMPTDQRRETLRAIATSLEAGEPLEQALQAVSNFPGFKSLMLAIDRLEDRVALLSQLLEHQRRMSSERRVLGRSLRYPAVLVILGTSVVFTLPLLFAPVFEGLFQELRIQADRSTLWMIAIGNRASPTVLGALGLLIVGGGLARYFLNRSWRSAILSSLPLLGQVWQWTGTAELQRWLSLLITARVPLPEALRIAAMQVENIELRNSSQRLAACLEQGELLSRAVYRTRVWPAATLPLLDWGERSAALPDALTAAAEMLEGRARSRAYWIRVSVPPLIVVIIGVMVVSLFSAILLPAVQVLTRTIGAW